MCELLKGECTFRTLLESIGNHPEKDAILDSVISVCGSTIDVHVHYRNGSKRYLIFDPEWINEGEEIL